MQSRSKIMFELQKIFNKKKRNIGKYWLLNLPSIIISLNYSLNMPASIKKFKKIIVDIL
jgi:hypothetical protein